MKTSDIKWAVVLVVIVALVVLATLIVYNLYAPGVPTWGPVELGPAVPE